MQPIDRGQFLVAAADRLRGNKGTRPCRVDMPSPGQREKKLRIRTSIRTCWTPSRELSHHKTPQTAPQMGSLGEAQHAKKPVKQEFCLTGCENERRGGDSNPRSREYPDAALAKRCYRPLSHLSDTDPEAATSLHAVRISHIGHMPDCAATSCCEHVSARFAETVFEGCPIPVREEYISQKARKTSRH